MGFGTIMTGKAGCNTHHEQDGKDTNGSDSDTTCMKVMHFNMIMLLPHYKWGSDINRTINMEQFFHLSPPVDTNQSSTSST